MGDPSDVSDEVLWCQVVNGDGDAFGILFDRHHDRVWRHATKVLGQPHVAEDVTAVVFYEAWRRRASIRMVNDSILPWLLVTTNNLIPGVTASEQANFDGKVGVAIGRTEPLRAGQRAELIIDPANGLVIGERTIMTYAAFGFESNEVTGHTAIDYRIVDSAPQ